MSDIDFLKYAFDELYEAADAALIRITNNEELSDSEFRALQDAICVAYEYKIKTEHK